MSTKEDCENAIEWSKSLHQKDPSNPRILTRWGITLLSLSGYHRSDADESNNLLQDAILKLEEALNLDPNDHEALAWLGRTYTTKGLQTSDPDAANVCFDKADQSCGKAYDLQPQNRTYEIYFKDVAEARKIQPLLNKRGPATEAPGPFSSMSTKEEFEKALRYAEALSKKYPGDATIMTKWGIILVGCRPESAGGYGSIKLLQDGIEKLEAALEIDPNKDDAWMWLGSAYKTKGLQTPDPKDAEQCFDKADKCYRKACELQPENWEYKLYLEDPSDARRTHSVIQKMKSLAAAAPRLSESSMLVDATRFGMFGSISADEARGALESSSSTSSEPSSPLPKKRKEKQ